LVIYTKGVKMATRIFPEKVDFVVSDSAPTDTTVLWQDTTANAVVPTNQPVIEFVSGKIYSGVGARASSAAISLNNTYYLPFYVPSTCTFDQIIIGWGSTLTGGPATVRLGIYDNVGGQPLNVIIDAGTVSVATASTAYPLSINVTLQSGIYWLATNIITVPTTYTIISMSTSTTTGIIGLPISSMTLASGSAAGYRESFNATSGFTTAVTANLSTTTTVPALGLRKA
jgi:hypothetical protein